MVRGATGLDPMAPRSAVKRGRAPMARKCFTARDAARWYEISDEDLETIVPLAGRKLTAVDVRQWYLNGREKRGCAPKQASGTGREVPARPIAPKPDAPGVLSSL